MKKRPLSFAQQRHWFLENWELGTALSNISCAVRLRGPLDAEAMRRVLAQLLMRHEVLRTRFLLDGEEPIQIIEGEPQAGLRLIDFSGDPQAERRAVEWLQGEASQGFDLACCPLFRAALVRIDARDHVLVLIGHRIVIDSASMGVALAELARLYSCELRGDSPPAAPSPIQYTDYIEQEENLRERTYQSLAAYWKAQLAGLAPLDLPTDRPRSRIATQAGSAISCELPSELVHNLRRRSKEQSVTLDVILLAAFQMLLSRYTGQFDFATGVPLLHRHGLGVDGLIGPVAGMLVLRADLEGDPTFRQAAARVAVTWAEASTHRYLPFERLVHEVKSERHLSYSPLFQVIFALHPQVELQFEGLEARMMEVPTTVTPVDWSLYLTGFGERLYGRIEYNTDLFDRERMENVAAHYLVLLDAVAANPDHHLSTLPVLSSQERQQILVDWNQTGKEYPEHLRIQDLFEDQVKRTPESPALVWGQTSLTYIELNERANRLAHFLISRGFGPEDLIGVALPRSAEMIIALLAILKAGAAYLPIEPTHPLRRLQFLFEDARPACTLTNVAISKALPPGATFVPLNEAHSAEAIRSASPANPTDAARRAPLTPANAAYVIYTSGSTGTPKGVVIEHRSTVALLFWAALFRDSFSGVLALTSLGFDVSVFEIFAPLCWGGTVLLADEIPQLLSMGYEGRIRLVSTSSSIMSELLNIQGLLQGVETVALAGEPLRRGLVDRIFETTGVRQVFNLYGPTEDTTYSTWELILRGDRGPVTIGKPIDNTRVYVLDRNRQPVPIGVTGELHLAGSGLARGYLNRPETTAERFVANPFEASRNRMYRTGDLVKWRADGKLEFLGRTDHQVKLHGIRIELGEIEAALGRHADVQHSVVTLAEDTSGDKRLVAYVAAKPDARFTSVQLRAFLSDRLPDYMVPATFVILDRLPLNPSGKVERSALPDPNTRGSSPSPNVPATTRTEEVLVRIWSSLLGIERLGIHDDFFELGGHSLLAIRILLRIRATLGIDIGVREFFQRRTIASLAAFVDGRREAQGDRREAIQPVPRTSGTPLSLNQEYRLFLQWLATTRRERLVPFHTLLSLRFSGAFDLGALTSALDEIVQRHEALRTGFSGPTGILSISPVARGMVALAPLLLKLINISLIQKRIRASSGNALLRRRLFRQTILPTACLAPRVVDLTNRAAGQQPADLQAAARQEIARPFAPADPPLARATLFRLSQHEHVLLLVIHHLVCDGWSADILRQEISLLYDCCSKGRVSPLSPLTIQFADFAAWQRSQIAGQGWQRSIAYWKGQLPGFSTLASPLHAGELAISKSPPGTPTYAAAGESIEMTPTLSGQVLRLCAARGATPYMALYAAFSLLLHRYSRRKCIRMWANFANRTLPETQDVVGWFSQSHLLSLTFDGAPSFVDLLERAREVVSGALAHQEVPISLLWTALGQDFSMPKTIGEAPHFCFDWETQPDRIQTAGSLQIRREHVIPPFLKFGIWLVGGVYDDRISLCANYSVDWFDAQAVRRLGADLVAILEAAVAAPESVISERAVAAG